MVACTLVKDLAIICCFHLAYVSRLLQKGIVSISNFCFDCQVLFFTAFFIFELLLLIWFQNCWISLFLMTNAKKSLLQ